MKHQKPGIAFLCLLALIIALATVDHFMSSEVENQDDVIVENNDSEVVEFVNLMY